MFQAIFVSNGAAIDYWPDEDVAAGDIVSLGDLIGIAKTPIKAETLGAIAIQGVFDIVKEPGESLTAGAEVFWDDETHLAGTSGTVFLGCAVAAAGPDDQTVRTLIVPSLVSGGIGSA